MRFHHSDATHIVTRISGPQHNDLSVTFAAEGQSPDPRIVDLLPLGGCEHRTLDRCKVLAAVLAGVEDGNRESGTSFAVASVRFVANDTDPEEIYRTLAKSLVAEMLRLSPTCRTDRSMRLPHI